jgi:hypothetical protein
MTRRLLNLLLALLLLLPPGVCACQLGFGSCATVEGESETPGSPCPHDHVHTPGCLATPTRSAPLWRSRSLSRCWTSRSEGWPGLRRNPPPRLRLLPSDPARPLFVSHCSLLI